MAQVDIPRTFGALLLGGLVAATFSGVTTVQACIYCKLFPNDRPSLKLLVLLIWFLDTIHTFFVGASIWDYLIAHFGDAEWIDHVPSHLALTIAVTAILTMIVHFFFTYRIHRLSRQNWILTIPLFTLACARVAFAFLTTAKLITLQSLKAFVAKYTWSFTLGLSISSLVDILITGCLCFLLKRTQKETTRLNRVLDKLILYAFEVGALTTMATLLTLICWLTMQHNNLIFMGVHFIICKFYANSLLATLNRRKGLLASEMPATVSGFSNLPIFARGCLTSVRQKWQGSALSKASKLRIDVEKSTHTEVDTLHDKAPAPLSPAIVVTYEKLHVPPSP